MANPPAKVKCGGQALTVDLWVMKAERLEDIET
jgi:hypothetical protein